MDKDQAKRLELIVRCLFGVIARARLMETLHGDGMTGQSADRFQSHRILVAARGALQQAKATWFTLFQSAEIPPVEQFDEQRVQWQVNFFMLHAEGSSQRSGVPVYHLVESLLDVAEAQYQAADAISRMFR